MAKRDTEIENNDEVTPVEESMPTVGERLRAAREEKGLSLDDLAAQTRIPLRHLQSIETADWDALPAPTYTTGFAKSYASAVGLDRTEIGDQLRAEMGGERFTANAIETFEPADPRRTMPKSLVIGTVAGLIVLIALMSWLNQRSLEQPEEAPSAAPPAAEATAPAQPAQAPTAAPATGQPVVLTANAPVWLQVSEKGGPTLFSGMLLPGQTYAVPATASAPVLKTGKPEALQARVGNQVAPPVGPAATTVNNVSLLPADLMKAGAATPAPAATTAAPAPKRARARTEAPAGTPAPATPPEAAPADTTPVTTNAGE
jgi:cytoskeletal protein RodZ